MISHNKPLGLIDESKTKETNKYTMNSMDLKWQFTKCGFVSVRTESMKQVCGRRISLSKVECLLLLGD